METRNRKYYTYVGIDPGKYGAVAIISDPYIPRVYDIPLTQDENIDIYRLGDILSAGGRSRPHETLVIIEKVNSYGQGRTSAFTFGCAYGICLGVAGGLGCPTKLVTPQSWKKYYPELETDEIKKLRKKKKECDSSSEKKKAGNEIKKQAKAQARRIAEQLYPELRGEFDRVRDSDRAEALLIAHATKNKMENR